MSFDKVILTGTVIESTHCHHRLVTLIFSPLCLFKQLVCMQHFHATRTFFISSTIDHIEYSTVNMKQKGQEIYLLYSGIPISRPLSLDSEGDAKLREGWCLVRDLIHL